MKRRPRDSGAERVPNLAPMVDVIMVLLVFFILGASLQIAREGVLRTELDPRSGPGEGAAVEIIASVKIALQDLDNGRACRILVMGRPLERGTPDELRRYMQERRAAGADPLNPVVITAERSVRWRHVVAAMDAAKSAGFDNVQFAVSLGRAAAPR